MADRNSPAEQPDSSVATSAAVDWEAVQASEPFERLRHTFRGFNFPMTAAFLAWYLAYVLCAAYARDFMNVKVFGNVSIGLIWGLLQFVSTFAIAIAYARRANRVMDPQADAIRADIEGEAS